MCNKCNQLKNPGFIKNRQNVQSHTTCFKWGGGGGGVGSVHGLILTEND